MVGAGRVRQPVGARVAGRAELGGGDRAGGEDQAGRLGPRGGRAHRLPDDGEPLLRPLLRRLPARAAASTTTPSTRSACSPRTTRADGTSSPSTSCCRSTWTARRPRVHRRPDPRLGADARVLEPRQDGPLGQGPHRGRSGRGQRRDDDGLLHARRPAFHWALADHFTLCDAYHCSILGPTHPNRLMANQRHDRPGGQAGRPGRRAPAPRADTLWNCTWTTVQEVLQDTGVSWKVYTPDQRRRQRQVRVAEEVPDLGPGALRPDHATPRCMASPTTCCPTSRRSATRHAAVPQGVQADVPQRLRRRRQARQAPEGLVDHPAARLRRAPVVVAAQRQVVHLAGARRAERRTRRSGQRPRCS